MTPGLMDFRGPMGFRKAVGFSGPMSSRGAHRNDNEKSACEAARPFFFGDHLILTEKTVRISVKTFFWRSLYNFDKTAGFSASVLEFTKSEICHI